MREVQTAEEVVAELRAIGAARIGIDGTDGAGKTTIAKAVAKLLGVPSFTLDDYLIKKQGGFVNFVQADRLLRDLPEKGGFIIDGVCLREVLSKGMIEVDAHVYVKRYHLGYWADEQELDLEEPLEQFLAQERATIAGILGRETIEAGGLGEEIIRYHFNERPHRHAAVVFRRNDG